MGLSDYTSISIQTREETTFRNVIISYININEIHNKFSGFSEVISDLVDVLVITKTKIDSSFPTNQFIINGFKWLYRCDISGNSGGSLVYVRDGLCSKSLDLVGT